MNIPSNEFQNKNRKPEMIVHVFNTNNQGSRDRETLNLRSAYYTIVSRPARGYIVSMKSIKKETRKTFIYLENKGNFKMKTPKQGGSDTHL